MTLGGFYASQQNWDHALAWTKKAQEQQPDNLQIQTALASLYMETGKPEEGRKLIDKVLEKDNENLRARFLKAQVLMKENKLKEAAELLDGILKDQPGYADAYYYRGLIYLSDKDQARAKASLLKAVDYNPNNLNARIRLAEVYLTEGAGDLAMEQANAVIARDTRNYQAYLLKGNALLLKRDTGGAREAYEKAAGIGPDNPAAYYQLATLSRVEGRYDQALSYLDKVLQLKPDHLLAMTTKVSVYLARKEPAKALAFLDGSLEKHKDSKPFAAVLHELRGAVLFSQQRYDQSEDAFKKAMELDPGLISPYISLARLYQVKKETDKAISQYQAIVAQEPKFAPAYMALGAIYDAEGRTSEARTMYEKVLELKPNFAPAANNLAWILLQSGQDPDKALELAKSAKAQLPDDPNVSDTLGLALIVKGFYPSAISELNEAAAKLPQNPTVLYHLALAHWKNGDKKASLDPLQKSLALKRPFPEEKQARELSREIKAAK
jgi:tetratricopeptide (TPR) repeat protein